ncbi:MAG: aspartyl protease family protein, partial [Planctomycetota bacterium]
VKILLLVSIVVFNLSVFSPQIQSQDNDEVTIKTAVHDLKIGDPRRVVDDSVLLLKIDQKNAMVHALYGLALIDCGEYEKADKEMLIALSHDPDSPEAHLGIGKLLFAKGDRKEAIEHLKKATSTVHLKYMTYEFLGACLSYLDEHEEAARVYTQALNDLPDLSEDEKTFLKNNIAIYEGYGKRRLYQIPDDFQSTCLCFTNSDGHILMPIKVNGTDIGSVHLDTGGSGGLTLSAEWAEKLNLRIIGHRIGRNVAKELEADVAMLDEIQFGDLVIRNVPVNLYKGSAFHGKSSGNLGKEVLQRLNMTLDFKHSELYFFHPKHPELQAGQIDGKNATEIIPFYNTKFIVVRASINGHETQPFILDTGAGAVVFHQDYYFDVLQPPEKGGERSKLQAPKPYQIKSILLGNRAYKDQFSIAMDLRDLYTFAKLYYPGIIGNPLFQSSKLHFNFVDSTLIIEEIQ